MNYLYRCFLTPSEYAECSKYAGEADDTTCYDKRDGQTDAHRRITQNGWCKIGEKATYYAIRDFCAKIKCTDFSLTPPDMRPLQPWEKSWGPDLVLTHKNKEYPVFCKCQGTSSARSQGLSWIVQKNDRFFNEAPDDVKCSLCLYVEETGEVLVLPFIPVGVVRKNKREPNIQRLRATKWAVYYSDLHPVFPLWSKLLPRQWWDMVFSSQVAR